MDGRKRPVRIGRPNGIDRVNTFILMMCGLGLVAMGAGCSTPSSSPGDDARPSRPDALLLYDFRSPEPGSSWQVEDDGVMGGRSKGAFAINDDGHGVFSGDVSLENNGGFSSIQYFFPERDIRGYTTASIRLKGDGRNYRFLVEATEGARHYYVYEFATSGDWQTVDIPLRDMFPERRGDRLDLPNFPAETLAQVRFLIANKKAESFQLLIDRIWLR